MVRRINSGNKVKPIVKEDPMGVVLPVVFKLDSMPVNEVFKFAMGLSCTLLKVNIDIEEGKSSIPFTLSVETGGEKLSKSLGPISAGIHSVSIDAPLEDNSKVSVMAEKVNDFEDVTITIILLTPVIRIGR